MRSDPPGEPGVELADSDDQRELAALFQRGENPHFSGINTFLKAPHLQELSQVGEHQVAVVGVPLDAGAAHRPGPRFGPQGMRRISALHASHYCERGADLLDGLDIVDLGDIFLAPADLDAAFDRITRGVAYIVSHGVFPVVLGGDHSVGYPAARGVMEAFGGKIGVIHFDRHLEAREPAGDRRAAHETHFDLGNLVQIGVSGWQAARAPARDGSLVIAVEDVEERGLDSVADQALEAAWSGGARGVYLSFDIDAVDPGFAPGTGWPDPGGLYPREALRLVRRFAAEGLLGMEVVEVAPPYDSSDVTSLLGVRLICEVLAASVASGHLG
ncbi:agmatinase family protein [Spongiactinospora gelatinilytica]|nr:agmatinase family protein [Spongiactinospora gelatinilytica]